MSDRADPIVFEPSTRVRRRLIGLRRKDVLRELEERDAIIETTRKRAEAAGADAERLRAEIAELHSGMEQARQEIAALHEVAPTSGTHAAGHSSKFCDCPPSETLLEEMTKIVSATEESTRKILDHARTTLMREIDAAEALRQQARSEIAQAAAWRQHWGPVIQAFQDTIREAQGAVDDIPDRIRHALAPLTAAAAALDHDLLQFAAFDGSIQRSIDGDDGADPRPDAGEAAGPAMAEEEQAVVVGEAEDQAIVIGDAAAAKDGSESSDEAAIGTT